MAGSKRIQNIINPLLEDFNIQISNIVFYNNSNKIAIRDSCKVKIIPIRYGANLFTMFTFYWKGWNCLRKIKKADSKNVVYCYDTPNILTFPFLLGGKVFGYKVVADIVEDYSLIQSSQLSRLGRLKLIVQNKLVKKIGSYCSGIIVLSDYLKDQMERLTKKKIPVIYYPITVNLNYFKSEQKEQNNSVKLFYGGSFGIKDGVLFILEAFAKLSEKHSHLELVLTGKPPKAGMKEVEDFIANSGVKNKIHYLGYLSDEEYYKTMNGCDVFLATRINSKYAHAGFPFKLGEMLATGKPVIATKVGDIEKYLTDNVNAIVIDPDSANQIYDAIELLILSPELRTEIGANGRKVAEMYFDAYKKSSELKHFIENVI